MNNLASSVRRSLSVTVATGALLLAGCGGEGASDDCVKVAPAFERALIAASMHLEYGMLVEVDTFSDEIVDAGAVVPADLKDSYDIYVKALLDYVDGYAVYNSTEEVSQEEMDLATEALDGFTSTEAMTALEEVATYFITECSGD